MILTGSHAASSKDSPEGLELLGKVTYRCVTADIREDDLYTPLARLAGTIERLGKTTMIDMVHYHNDSAFTPKSALQKVPHAFEDRRSKHDPDFYEKCRCAIDTWEKETQQTPLSWGKLLGVDDPEAFETELKFVRIKHRNEPRTILAIRLKKRRDVYYAVIARERIVFNNNYYLVHNVPMPSTGVQTPRELEPETSSEQELVTDFFRNLRALMTPADKAAPGDRIAADEMLKGQMKYSRRH